MRDSSGIGGGDRDPDRNPCTVVVPRPWMLARPVGALELFTRNYAQVRRLLHDTDSAGYLAVAAKPSGELDAFSFLRAGPWEGIGDAVVIGRHSQASLRLAEDPSIALRHLVLRVRRDEAGAVLTRIIDLHTGQGFFIDGLGHCAAALTSGVVFVAVGAYGLLLIPTVDGGWSLPDDPQEAWHALPRPARLDLRQFKPGDAPPVLPMLLCANDDHSGSFVGRLPEVTGVRPFESLPRASEPPYGLLTWRGRGRHVMTEISDAQLSAGILIGRYPRCQLQAEPFEADVSISRVHLLILKDGDRVFAVDTASTNGTTVDSVRAVLAELGDDSTIALGLDQLLHWRRWRGEASKQPA